MCRLVDKKQENSQMKLFKSQGLMRDEGETKAETKMDSKMGISNNQIELAHLWY